MKRISPNHGGLHRFLSGVAIYCLFLVVIGSSVSGVRVLTILERAFLFLFLYLLCWYVLVKTWRTWEEVKEAGQRSSTR